MATTIARQVSTRIKSHLDAGQTFIGGADLGNSTSLYKTGETIIQIPSFVGVGNLDDLLNARLGSGGSAVLKTGEYAIEHGGVCYFVGQLAVDQLADASTQRGDYNRYTNGHTLLLLMALTAAAHPGLDSIKVRLVTGLPIKLFKERPALKNDVRAALEGTHFYTFHDSNGSRAIALDIEAVGVVMEGLAAAKAFGEKGKPMLVVDIGGGSFDAAYIDARGEVVESRSGSLMHNGSERIGEMISMEFRRQYGRALTPNEIDEVLRNYLQHSDTTIYESGERIITLASVQRAIDTVTASGNSFLSQKLGPRPGSDAALAFVIGGAARYVRPTLHCRVEMPQTPERTNVEAYAAFAQQAEINGAWPKKAV